MEDNSILHLIPGYVMFTTGFYSTGTIIRTESHVLVYINILAIIFTVICYIFSICDFIITNISLSLSGFMYKPYPSDLWN